MSSLLLKLLFQISNLSRVYSWGWGIHGQLGHGDVEEKLVPQHVKALANKNVVRVAGGYNHTIILTSQVHVVSCFFL